MKEVDREEEVPINPLNKGKITVTQLSDSLRITFHVEFGHNDISELDSNIFHVSPLNEDEFTMVEHMDSSRLSELALTYACIYIYN